MSRIPRNAIFLARKLLHNHFAFVDISDYMSYDYLAIGADIHYESNDYM